MAGRRLHRGHFAFMRAVVQGVDARASWERFLFVEGEHTDLRIVRRTITWIRDEFAAAAKRHERPGTARLILFDPRSIPEGPPQPTLAEFAAANGWEEFSEAEQAEAYAQAFGGPGPRSRRRARLIDKQLQALWWLEGLVAQEPAGLDPVSAWLAPALAMRLQRAGIETLSRLVAHINGVGARWWTAVPGIGALKAGRIVEWLRRYEVSIGWPIGEHVEVARSRLLPAELDAVVPRATGLVPLEKFVVPGELDGRAGRFRAPPAQCLLEAQNDYEAILAWLACKRSGEGGSQSTTRAYRRAAAALGGARARQAALVLDGRGRERVPGLPGGATGGLVRAAAPATLVAALAAARRAAERHRLAPGHRRAGWPIRLPGEPELCDRQPVRGSRPAGARAAGSGLTADADVYPVGLDSRRARYACERRAGAAACAGGALALRHRAAAGRDRQRALRRSGEGRLPAS